MNADVPETGHVQAQEPGAVGVLDGAFPVSEIVRDALGIQELIDLELSFRGFVVSPHLLGTIKPGAGHAVLLDDVAFGIYQRELEGGFVHHDERGAAGLFYILGERPLRPGSQREDHG